MRRFHVMTADGRLVSGGPAFVALAHAAGLALARPAVRQPRRPVAPRQGLRCVPAGAPAVPAPRGQADVGQSGPSPYRSSPQNRWMRRHASSSFSSDVA
jgi:hypothetical protein